MGLMVTFKEKTVKNMNYHQLSKIINKTQLPYDHFKTSEYLEIINDYMIDYHAVQSVVFKADEIKKRNQDFNEYDFIVYGLIGYGKDKKLMLKEKSYEARQNCRNN